ncbi:hypothetical protein ACWGQ5_24710, partial [Streptomyces sp. NPDC055722]
MRLDKAPASEPDSEARAIAALAEGADQVPGIVKAAGLSRATLNPPPAEAGGFLAHVGCGSATSSSYTINTSR